MTKAIIKGPTIVKCKIYIVSKAYKIILKKTPTDKAIRPFYRIHVDLI